MSRESPRGASTEAKHNPVVMSGQLDSTQRDIGQSGTRAVQSDGDDVELSPSQIVVADRVYDNEKMAMLAFFNEMITIRILPTSDKAAEKVFEINVNGRAYLFRRGQSYTVPRFVVDRIIRLKQTVYDQEEIINKEGVKEIRYPSQTALKYNYVIERDANPRGPDWERVTLAETA